jgi:hypothetical protein
MTRPRKQKRLKGYPDPPGMATTPTHNWGQGSTIPARVKDQVRRRDGVCQIAIPGVCTGRIDEMDHVVGLAEQGQRRTPTLDANALQGVCSPCHKVKTQQQAAAGRARAIAQRGGLSKRLRDRESDPGLIRPDSLSSNEKHDQSQHDATAESHADDDEQTDDQWTHGPDEHQPPATPGTPQGLTPGYGTPPGKP